MINKNNIAILTVIAEYKYLTVKQISILCQRSPQTIRRSLRNLAKNKLVFWLERTFGGGVGRKEHVMMITNKGFSLLKEKRIAYTQYKINKTSELGAVEHDLLVNWFFIHLIQIQKTNERFSVFLLTSNSYHLKLDGPDNPLIMKITQNGEGRKDHYTMIPDGVFTITDKKSRKTLLFFLEVDMGTETLGSPKQRPGDIIHKVNNYQAIFEFGMYKKFGRISKCKLNGFRLLFLTNTLQRMKSICNIVREMSPSDFIWVTDQQSIFSKGASSEIWARGGDYGKKLESILNERLAFNAPIPTGLV